MTTIAVLGNGRVGGNLAAALTRAGHEVTFADRTPGAAADAARRARIVINATPGAGSLDRRRARIAVKLPDADARRPARARRALSLFHPPRSGTAANAAGETVKSLALFGRNIPDTGRMFRDFVEAVRQVDALR